jgi:hypothetical protein
MTEAARTSETSVDNYFTRQYIPEDNYELHTRRRENLKSHKEVISSPTVHLLPHAFQLSPRPRNDSRELPFHLEDGCVPYSEGIRKTWCGGGTKDLSNVDCVERNIKPTPKPCLLAKKIPNFLLSVFLKSWQLYIEKKISYLVDFNSGCAQLTLPKTQRSRLYGVMVSVLVIRPKARGFKPDQDDG